MTDDDVQHVQHNVPELSGDIFDTLALDSEPISYRIAAKPKPRQAKGSTRAERILELQRQGLTVRDDPKA
jgi:hypothetical protein